MSSSPFRLGIPVVDHLPAISGDYVLRSKNEDAHIEEIQRLQQELSVNDIIKIYRIGLRPDHPIPISQYFTEVHVGIGEVEEWRNTFNGLSLYHNVVTGLNDL